MTVSDGNAYALAETVDAPDKPMPLGQLAEKVREAADELATAFTEHASATTNFVDAAAMLEKSERRVEKARAGLRHFSDRLTAASATEVENIRRDR